MAEPDGGGLYGPDDVAGFDYERDLSRPGEYPYTRGIHADMYRGRLWTMRQYAGFGDARQTNSRFRYLLEKGQTGLSVAFDLPTQMGYDSDDRLSEGEVGRVGVAIDTVEDLDVLFAGIPLDTVSVSMTINATAGILVAMYAVLARRRGYDLSRLSGTLQNDILKEYVARGTYIFPPRPSLRLVTDTIGFCLRTLPRFNPISISGYHIREAGATAVQEVAFTFADAIAYVKACIEAGFQVDQFAPRLSFFFNAHNNLLEEVAKFRAARRLWGRIMREEFRAGDPRSWMLRFHTQTAGSMLTAQQPENNIVRVALQALAAVLGGTQSLHTNSFDEALGLPTERSVEIALRTQQLLAHESGLTEVVDPLGGAYAIETLTNGIEQKAREYLRRIDELGGAVPAIEKGYFQQEISDSAFRYQREVETAERVVVGVNRFQGGDETPRDILRVDSRVREEQVQRLTTYRRGRDEETLARALLSLEKGARGEEPLVPLMIDCVEARGTLGEISGVLRRVFGEYK
jgi:methylmalonyl-CoA mutase N-terminal domain/subunit